MRKNLKFFAALFAAVFAMVILTTNKAEAQTKEKDDAISTWISSIGTDYATITLKFYEGNLGTLKARYSDGREEDTVIFTYKGNSKAKSGPIILYLDEYYEDPIQGVIEKDSKGYYMDLDIEGERFYRQ